MTSTDKEKPVGKNSDEVATRDSGVTQCKVV